MRQNNDRSHTIACVHNIERMKCHTSTYFFPEQTDQASDKWQQLELASELESHLQDTGLGQELAC